MATKGLRRQADLAAEYVIGEGVKAALEKFAADLWARELADPAFVERLRNEMLEAYARHRAELLNRNGSGRRR